MHMSNRNFFNFEFQRTEIGEEVVNFQKINEQQFTKLKHKYSKSKNFKCNLMYASKNNLTNLNLKHSRKIISQRNKY